MIALDTNVLLRCITMDDATQLPVAQRLLNHSAGVFVAKSVLLEVEWALRDVFDRPRTIVLSALNNLCGMAHVRVENEAQVAQALSDYLDHRRTRLH